MSMNSKFKHNAQWLTTKSTNSNDRKHYYFSAIS